MKGVSIIHDQTRNKRFVQIDLEKLEKFQSEIEDLLDAIIAESRKGEEKTSLEKFKDELKKEGKL